MTWREQVMRAAKWVGLAALFIALCAVTLWARRCEHDRIADRIIEKMREQAK